MEKVLTFGTSPKGRFGHTATLISKTRLILFGGATGDSKGFKITNETFCFDLRARFWKKLEGIIVSSLTDFFIAKGSIPQPRAAHGAAAVGINQMILYGGATGGGELSSDDLYLLDLKNGEEKAMWHLVPVVGVTPGRRYGHSLVYAHPFLVIFGGQTGNGVVNDIWCLHLEKKQFLWEKVNCKSEIPCPRVYHSATLCQHGSADGMIVVFGGRSDQQIALNDTWGLRRHRSGEWDWVKAPQKDEVGIPQARYQHSSLFVGNAMVVLGGKTNEGEWNSGMEIFDTSTSAWYRTSGAQTWRHASWFENGYIYIFGGFESETPTVLAEPLVRLNIHKVFQEHKPLSIQAEVYVEMDHSYLTNPDTSSTEDDKRSAASYSPRHNSLDSSFSENVEKLKGNRKHLFDSSSKNVAHFASTIQVILEDESDKNQAKKTIYYAKPNEDLKKIKNNSKAFQESMPKPHFEDIATIFLNKLLRPKDNININPNGAFDFKYDLIIELCDQAEAILQSQPMVLRPQAPVKIFGDIHGQYSDLMRFFDLFGSPCYGASQEGDIECFDYLFLGDFVDRGAYSLETICLLLALKIKYPDQIHLIRGNHEDRGINIQFGFADECAYRLGEDPTDPSSVFNRINCLFEWLPLAAIIDDKILCVHGGIGFGLNKIEEIEKLERPLEIMHEVFNKDHQIILDVLWSDPTESDSDLGIQFNDARDPGRNGKIVKFGPDRVAKFLENNNLSMVIRAHECVLDGFERFAAGLLITVFSATDYCRRHKNAGAMLVLKKNMEIVPKLIYPIDSDNQNWIEDEESLKRRPPTPPRWRNNAPRKKSFN